MAAWGLFCFLTLISYRPGTSPPLHVSAVLETVHTHAFTQGHRAGESAGAEPQYIKTNNDIIKTETKIANRILIRRKNGLIKGILKEYTSVRNE